jgi:hypothetical protein
MVVMSQADLKTKAGSSRRVSIISYAVLGLIAALVLALAVRLDHSKPSRQVVARVASADASIVAVLYEQPVDAKSSFAYQVEIVANGQSQTVAELSGAMRSDRAYGVNLVWSGNDNLGIEYLKADSQKLLIDDVSAGSQKVHVALHSGIRDSDALPGGMLFNLRQSQSPGGL